jgi:hypothetical protein
MNGRHVTAVGMETASPRFATALAASTNHGSPSLPSRPITTSAFHVPHARGSVTQAFFTIAGPIVATVFLRFVCYARNESSTLCFEFLRPSLSLLPLLSISEDDTVIRNVSRMGLNLDSISRVSSNATNLRRAGGHSRTGLTTGHVMAARRASFLTFK